MGYNGMKAIGLVSPNQNTPIGAWVGLFETTSALEYTDTADETDIEGWPPASENCQQEVVDSTFGPATRTATLTYKQLNFELLQHLMGEFAQVSSSYVARQNFSGRVPASLEVVTPFITAAAELNTTAVGFLSRGGWGERGAQSVVDFGATPVPAAGQVTLDAANTKLIFPAGSEGAPFACSLDVEILNAETIGVESNPLAFIDMDFSGEICTKDYATLSGIGVRIRRMQAPRDINLALDAANPEPQVAYKVLTEVGRREPIEFWKRVS